MLQMVSYLVYLCLDSAEFLLHRLHVELGNLPDRLLYQFVDVIHDDRSLKQILISHHLVKDFL